MKTYIVKNESIKNHMLVELQALSLETVSEVVVRPYQRKRSSDQNALMWVGALSDISKQVDIDGKKFDAKIWHWHFKTEFLPDENLMELEELAKQVKSPETYKKWMITPNGERVLNGSTTDLTKYGFGEYLEQIYAYGANLGVRFSAAVS